MRTVIKKHSYFANLIRVSETRKAVVEIIWLEYLYKYENKEKRDMQCHVTKQSMHSFDVNIRICQPWTNPDVNHERIHQLYNEWRTKIVSEYDIETPDNKMDNFSIGPFMATILAYTRFVIIMH